MIYLLLKFLSVLYLTHSTSAQLFINVTITNGTVTGDNFTVAGRNGWQFLGIPFAAPPVGNLRFSKPQPVQSAWSTPMLATKPGYRCVQMNYPNPIDALLPASMKGNFTEDCLNLNIWTPENATTSPRAVMVWIHGGGYLLGDGYPTYNGQALSVLGDVVVVHIQYRLGVFGFLRLDGTFGGNWGLWDQQMALQWVSENIRHFGGDPAQITIFGESAGGSSVSLQLLNAKSNRHFKRAIIQSGTPTANWAFNPNTQAITAKHVNFATFAGCTGDTNALVTCLRGKTASNLLTLSTNFMYLNMTGYTSIWLPILDGDFIQEDPRTSFHNGTMAKKDILMGVNQDEGGMLIHGTLLELQTIFGVSSSILTGSSDGMSSIVNYMYHSYPYFPSSMSTKAMDLLKRHIISQRDPTNSTENIVNLNMAFSLSAFDCPANDMADAYAMINSTVYLYQFTHRPSTSTYPSYIASTHGDELLFVFGAHLLLPFPVWANESSLSLQMIQDWATFAKTGKPMSVDWKPFTTNNKDYFRIDLKSTLQSFGIKRMFCEFWSTVVPTVNSLAISALAASSGQSKSTCTPTPRCPSVPICENLNLTGKILLAVLCVLAGINLIGIIVYCYRRCKGQSAKRTLV